VGKNKNDLTTDVNIPLYKAPYPFYLRTNCKACLPFAIILGELKLSNWTIFLYK
jgi:hypothetical protein